jgi:LmbE family N-acetylglucosaminyl deacetylase
MEITNSKPTNKTHRLLGIWSHPDDEAYLSAGLMARTVAEGGQVTIVTITDGEEGFPADDPRPPSEKAAQRRDELRTAMDAIGVEDIRFLGIPDGKVADVPGETLVSQIVEIITDVQPDLIVTFGPDGITGHPDHIANSRIATEAWLRTDCGDLLYTAKTTNWLEEWREQHDGFGIWMTAEPIGVSVEDIAVIVDLDGAELAQKRAVLAAHKSQTALVAEMFGEEQYQQWVREETFRRPVAAELEGEVLIAPDGCTKYRASLCSPTPTKIADWCHQQRPEGYTSISRELVRQ